MQAPAAVTKPTVFLGSSGECLPFARSLKEALAPELEVVLWSDQIFELGEDTLTSLLKFVSVFDFGIFVLSDDDLVTSKRLRSAAPRDNVVFELGMFMGALGRRRALPVVLGPRKGKLKTPTDLLGNTEMRLPLSKGGDVDTNELREAVAQLRNTIEERSQQAYLQLLPSTGLAVGYFKNFLLPVCTALAQREEIEMDGKTIDISRDNFDFHIVLPSTLSLAGHEGARRFKKGRGLVDFNLPSLGAGRPYPFFVDGECRDGRFQVYDYPTTLAASYDAIELALANDFLGQTDDHRVLERKEIANFQRTLEILLLKPEAAELAGNIQFIQDQS